MLFRSKKVRNPRAILQFIMEHEQKEFSQLDGADFLYLKKVVEKLEQTSADKTELQKLRDRMERVESRSGKRRVRYTSHRNPEMLFFSILRRANEENYETIHIKANAKPVVRQAGRLIHLSAESPYEEADIMDLLAEVLNPEEFARFQTRRQVASSFSIPGVSRFKISAFYEGRKPGICFRQVPQAIPAPQEVELDRKSTRLNSSHSQQSRMPSSA